MNKSIKKIELDLGGKIVSLTPQQAKNLKDALDELFGQEIVKTIREYIPYPQPMPDPLERYRRPYREPFWEWNRPYGCQPDLIGLSVTNTTYQPESSTLKLTG
jgi:hypothetical protein